MTATARSVSMMVRMSRARRFAAVAVLLTVYSTVWSRHVHAADEAPPTSAQPAGTRSEAPIAEPDLERMLAPIAGDDRQARLDAAKAIQALGHDSVPAIGRKLAELRKATSPGVAGALKLARDAAGKSPDVETADALVELGLGARGDAYDYRTAVSTAVLLKALAHIATTPAVSQLIKVSTDHGGAFRPEIARHVKLLGDKAVPALIETRKASSSELRHWAYSQLEGMGKRIPGDAVQTKDNQVLTDVLRAFAKIHDMDSLPVLLSFVNSDRIQVRNAARDALGQFGQDAVWKLREAYSNVSGKAAPEGWDAAHVAKELFSAYDRLRLQEVYGLLDEGLAREKEGKLEEAIAAFDKVLARQPLIDRRGEMVGAYAAYAKQIEDTDPARSLTLFRKAKRLWPESARAKQIEAEIAYLEGKELLARGVADLEPFQRALSLDPGHEQARAELTRLEASVEDRQARIRTFAAVGVAVVVALAGFLLFGGRRPPRRPARA